MFATSENEPNVNTKIENSFNRFLNLCQLLNLTNSTLNYPRSNFLNVEGSIARLYDCPHHLSPICIAEQCYDNFPFI